MGDIRADLEADLKLAEADTAAAKIVMDNAHAEYQRLRQVQADIRIRLMRLDFEVGSEWTISESDGYYGRRTYRARLVYVDETHVIVLAATIPKRLLISTFVKIAKKLPNAQAPN